MPPHHRKPPAQRNKRHRRARRLRLDPIGLSRTLKRNKAAGLVVALLLIVAIALLDRWAGVLPVDDDWHRYHGQGFEVLRVVDGDTIDLAVQDGEYKTTRVRLWGVDTPEMNARDPDTPPDRLAEDATTFTRDAVQGRRVTLHLQDHQLRGGYGRLLAYVELPDGTDLNGLLIKEGLSEHDDRWGHDRAEAYEALEREARENRRGLWAPQKP